MVLHGASCSSGTLPAARAKSYLSKVLQRHRGAGALEASVTAVSLTTDGLDQVCVGG